MTLRILFLWLVIVLLFGHGVGNVQAKAENSGNLELIFVDYEGPADLGRATIRIGRNFAAASWQTVARVVTNEKPWRKRLDLSPDDSKVILALARSFSVKPYHCESPVLMPGQNFTVKELKISVGKSPPFFSCSFVETPRELQDLVHQIGVIYETVKTKGRVQI